MIIYRITGLLLLIANIGFSSDSSNDRTIEQQSATITSTFSSALPTTLERARKALNLAEIRELPNACLEVDVKTKCDFHVDATATYTGFDCGNADWGLGLGCNYNCFCNIDAQHPCPDDGGGDCGAGSAGFADPITVTFAAPGIFLPAPLCYPSGAIRCLLNDVRESAGAICLQQCRKQAESSRREVTCKSCSAGADF